MSDHPRPHGEVHVRELPMPGNARLFALSLADGTVISVAADPDAGVRDLSITERDRDEATVTVTLRDDEATTLAALLSGVRFVVELAADHQPVGAANLRTLTLGPASPAVGRLLDAIEVPDPDEATVIAVIRDDTPELTEQDPERPCRPGDRLVLVGRPGAMDELVRHLVG